MPTTTAPLPRTDLAQLAKELRAGRLQARALIEAALVAIADPRGEGSRVFTQIFAERARREADAVDAALSAGQLLPPLAGLPLSVKDLFDVAGLPTTAGSVVLASAPPAREDAPVVRRLREAGAVIVGRTNMTELAFSGIGQNPHHGIPRNPFERKVLPGGRIPGGSSSGAAVSVTDGMAVAALGTDTGGSVRIPAALCGLCGWKPTARRYPLGGLVPLSVSFDSVGPLGRSVADVALLDAILAGELPAPPPTLQPRGLRLLAPQNLVLEELDEEVLRAYGAALDRLRSVGVTVDEVKLISFGADGGKGRLGLIGAAEAWRHHRESLARSGDGIDPRVRVRIESGRAVSDDELAALLRERARFRAEVEAEVAGYDALIWPTVPIVAPPIAALESEPEFVRLNALVLRNPAIVNRIDGCALSLPCHARGSAPVGLTLVGPNGHDAHLLAVAAALEGAVSALPG